MNASDIRDKYLEFFKSRQHAVIPRANLVPQDDATTLFTGSGMQPLIPYLLGQKHPQGTMLADSQTCFRAEDIDEVGNNRHTTFFEMLGNWSLGEYFKAEQLPWFWEFLTDIVGLDPQKLSVTAFIGDRKYNIPRDSESVEIWQRLFRQKGIEPQVVEIGSEADGYNRGIKPGEKIFLYDAKKNWWNRGEKGPETTPVGDPCGPCAEVFYELAHIEHDKKWGLNCHPNCDCGRFIEVGNSVFMQYLKREDGSLDELSQRNVDFGGGLERIAQAAEGSGDIFRISVIWPIITKLQELSGFDYADQTKPMRIIADHLRAATFLAVDGVVPSNNDQGYVMRRFIRRAIRQALVLDLREDFMDQIVPVVTEIYAQAYPELSERQNEVMDVLMREETQFRKTLERGVREVQKIINEAISAKNKISGHEVFRLFDTFGFPSELTLEEIQNWNNKLIISDDKRVELESNWSDVAALDMAEQKDRSRTATQGQFKGGLADHSEMSTKYHTATHLMYKALRLVLGDQVVQRGSNITPERLRFDFSYPEKMTPEQIAEVERIVNENIAKDWPMGWREMPTKEALASGVLGAFGHKYGDVVKVYTAGDPEGEWYSQEICGGPHVEHTGVLGHFKITKEEASSAGVRRIKAVLQ
jgi:alanyl-tRNA synthetase